MDHDDIENPMVVQPELDLDLEVITPEEFADRLADQLFCIPWYTHRRWVNVRVSSVYL